MLFKEKKVTRRRTLAVKVKEENEKRITNKEKVWCQKRALQGVSQLKTFAKNLDSIKAEGLRGHKIVSVFLIIYCQQLNPQL